jgi:hypothetical protein
MIREIELQDVGPIVKFTIPFPDEGQGKIIVLKAPNNTGKSVALEAVDKHFGGEGHPTRRRDAAGSGSIRGLGALVTLGQTTRTSGELAVRALSSRYRPDLLVDPGIKDSKKADRARIKALIELRGVKPDLKLFDELVDSREELERLVPGDVLHGGDVLAIQQALKKALEAAARKAEGEAKSEKGHAQADAEAAENERVDTSIEDDMPALVAAHEQAIADRSAKETQAQEAAKADHRRQEQEAELEKLVEKQAGGQTRDQVIAHCEEIEAKFDNAAKMLDAAQKAYTTAGRTVDAANNEYGIFQSQFAEAKRTRKAVIEREQAITQTRQTIAVLSGGPRPSEADLDKAASDVDLARSNIAAAEARGRARAALARRDKHAEKAASLESSATRLRTAAKSSEHVFAEMITGGKWSVRDERLLVNLDGADVLFAEQSAGTRWTVSIDETIGAARRVDAEAFQLQQEAWEGIDFQNRQSLNRQIRDTAVCMITGESSREEGDPTELTSYVYGEEQAVGAPEG